MQQAKLLGDTASTGIGSCVAIEGDTIVAGQAIRPFDAPKLRYGLGIPANGNQLDANGKTDGQQPDPVQRGSAFRWHSAAIKSWAALQTTVLRAEAVQHGCSSTMAFRGRNRVFSKRTFPLLLTALGNKWVAAGTALVGSPRDDDFRGSAYLFSLSPPAANSHLIDPTASEGGVDTAQFKVTRFGNTDGALRVFYEVSGTATLGVDYAPLRGFATIAAGETAALFQGETDRRQ